MKIVAFIILVWTLAVGVHFLWEAWVIAAHGFSSLPECRRWRCPHGFLNRMKGKQ